MENMNYLKELIKRFDAEIGKIKEARVHESISQSETEGFRIGREMQMVVPRILDDLQKTSAARRREIAAGIVDEVKNDPLHDIVETVEKPKETSTKTRKPRKTKKGKK